MAQTEADSYARLAVRYKRGGEAVDIDAPADRITKPHSLIATVHPSRIPVIQASRSILVSGLSA